MTVYVRTLEGEGRGGGDGGEGGEGSEDARGAGVPCTTVAFRMSMSVARIPVTPCCFRLEMTACSPCWYWVLLVFCKAMVMLDACMQETCK
jgi:hypothetical protein